MTQEYTPPVTEKRRYQAPILEDYGLVNDLTLGFSGVGGDGGLDGPSYTSSVQ